MDNSKFVNIVESNFSHILGKYSIAFKELGMTDMTIINDGKMKAASTIKIFVMIEAYRLKANKKLNFEDKVGGHALKSNEDDYRQYSIKKLIDLMMIDSDNTATNLLIDKIGMANINDCIESIGCNHTKLNRKMLDFKAIEKGFDNYTSTEDLALVLYNLYYSRCVNQESDEEMLKLMTKCSNNTKIPENLPYGIKVAHKTGELAGVENDAGIVYTDKGDYIICILTEQGKSEEEIAAISEFSRELYNSFTIK